MTQRRILKTKIIVKPSYEKNKGLIVIGSVSLKNYINQRVKVTIFKE